MQNQTPLDNNPLIQTLVEIGKENPLAYLEGYVGASGEAYIRLYGNLNLSYFAEIKRDTILHARFVPGDPNGRVQIFVMPDTPIELHSKRGKSAVAKASQIDVDDLNFCLIECALDKSGDEYFKCAEACEKKYGKKTSLFAHSVFARTDI